MGSEKHRWARLLSWPCSNVDLACSAEAPLYSPDVSAKIGGGKSHFCWPDIFPVAVHADRKLNLPAEDDWCVLPRAKLVYSVTMPRPAGAAPACEEDPSCDANHPRVCGAPSGALSLPFPQ